MSDVTEGVQLIGDTCIVRCQLLRDPATWTDCLTKLHNHAPSQYIILPPAQPVQYPQYCELPAALWELQVPTCIALICPTPWMLAAFAVAPQLQGTVLIAQDLDVLFERTNPSLTLRGALARDRLLYSAISVPNVVLSAPRPEVHWLRRCKSVGGQHVFVVYLSRLAGGTVAELLDGLATVLCGDCSEQVDLMLCEDSLAPWRPTDATQLPLRLNSSVPGSWLSLWRCGYVVSECEGPWWRLLTAAIHQKSKLSLLPSREIVGHLYGSVVLAAVPPSNSGTEVAAAPAGVSESCVDSAEVLYMAEQELRKVATARLEHNTRVDNIAHRFRVDAECEYESVVASLVGPEWTQALGQAQ